MIQGHGERPTEVADQAQISEEAGSLLKSGFLFIYF